jgi:hypothetical protein
MTYDDLWNAVQAGKYNTDLPYPAYLTLGQRQDPDKVAEHRAVRQAYLEDENRLERQFHDDLLEALGVADHPKADKLYQIAWDQGHASGYTEVMNAANELVELLR